MQKSKIELVRYFFKKFSIEWGYDESKNDSEKGLLLNYNVFRNNEEKELFRLDFYLKYTPTNKEKELYIDICVQGFFRFPKGTKEEEMQDLVRVNGCSILYSTLRGHVSTYTANFPCGVMLLPAVVISEVVQTIEKQREEKEIKTN